MGMLKWADDLLKLPHIRLIVIQPNTALVLE